VWADHTKNPLVRLTRAGRGRPHARIDRPSALTTCSARTSPRKKRRKRSRSWSVNVVGPRGRSAKRSSVAISMSAGDCGYSRILRSPHWCSTTSSRSARRRSSCVYLTSMSGRCWHGEPPGKAGSGPRSAQPSRRAQMELRWDAAFQTAANADNRWYWRWRGYANCSTLALFQICMPLLVTSCATCLNDWLCW
jgi:hypothetical protein